MYICLCICLRSPWMESFRLMMRIRMMLKTTTSILARRSNTVYVLRMERELANHQLRRQAKIFAKNLGQKESEAVYTQMRPTSRAEYACGTHTNALMKAPDMDSRLFGAAHFYEDMTGHGQHRNCWQELARQSIACLIRACRHVVVLMICWLHACVGLYLRYHANPEHRARVPSHSRAVALDRGRTRFCLCMCHQHDKSMPGMHTCTCLHM